MHRDIACRNCLISVKSGVVKISDFGLSKQAEFYNIPPDERLPIKWQAPEVISTRVYTVKCDVFSYGILLWEIFNNGEMPYKGIDNKTVRQKISDPTFRPPTDATLPIVIYRVMKTCWRGNPVKRPSMAQVVRYLADAPPELFLPKSSQPSNQFLASRPSASAVQASCGKNAQGRRSKSCERYSAGTSTKSKERTGKSNRTVDNRRSHSNIAGTARQQKSSTIHRCSSKKSTRDARKSTRK
ncbi:Protein kinase domain-containing protein [Trichostrongylus colubriformis]|uniref:Protein kinase domain-containing protein n=1 Tax=Trichostrongylus colubriformis TaxID=6319 RepID=A0AAN8IRV7_TRICO